MSTNNPQNSAAYYAKRDYAGVRLIALCLWREARGEVLRYRLAVRGIAHVILNRVADKHWPATVEGVILQPWQFSSFNAKDPNAVKYPSDGSVIWDACLEIAANPGDDPTGGANHYESCMPVTMPAWADPAKITLKAGPFRFYRL